DPPRAGRVRLGPAASLSLSRKLADWEWQLGFHSQFPGYEEIGYASRTDAHGLSLSARYAKDAWTVSVRARADLTEITTQPKLRLSGGVEGAWKGPWNASFSVNPMLSPSGRAPTLSVDFQAGLGGGENPSWSAGISGKLALPELYLAGSWTGKISYTLWPGFALALAWDRPYRTHGAPGTENLVLSARLAGGAGLAWSLSWEERLSHPVGGPSWTHSRTVSGELRPAMWVSGWGKVAPRLTGTLDMNPAELRGRGTISASAELPPSLVHLTLGVDQSFRPALERTATTFTLSGSWTYTGWKDVRPSLTYQRTWQVLRHPRYPLQMSESQNLDAQVVWELGGGNRHELTLSWSPAEGIKARDRLVWRTPWGPVQMEATLSWDAGRITGKARVEAGLSLARQWGLNLEGAVLFGGGPLRLAGLLGATLVATF
ncbi:MAG: hypothetical protein ACK42E_02085, partial [Candidatus Bipolaricaulaceae bacterium]